MVTRSLLALFALLAPFDGHAADRASAPMRAWDRLVSTDCFADIADFTRTIRQQGNERVYILALQADDGSPLMSVVVAVAPVGQRLDPVAWRAAVLEANAAERGRTFPDIGSRARMQAPRISPEGAFSGVVFATSDALFDVLVSVFEVSSAAPRGALTALEAARRIERAYDDTFQ